MVKLLGADKVIDYTKEDFTRSAATYDLIFDIVGATAFHGCKRSLKPNGVFLQNIMGVTDIIGCCGRPSPGKKKIKGVAFLGMSHDQVGTLRLTVGSRAYSEGTR